jgi:hypothetical protein
VVHGKVYQQYIYGCQTFIIYVVFVSCCFVFNLVVIDNTVTFLCGLDSLSLSRTYEGHETKVEYGIFGFLSIFPYACLGYL